MSPTRTSSRPRTGTPHLPATVAHAPERPGTWVHPPSARTGLAALMAGAAAFTVAFPPFPPLVGALVALAGFAFALEAHAARGGRLCGALALGVLFGALGHAPNIAWVPTGLAQNGPRALLVFVAGLAVPTFGVTLAAGALHLARRGSALPTMLLLPLCWVGGEAVLARLPDVAFPWLPVGLSVSHVPLLLQTADLSGVHAVSAWIAAVAGALVDAWRLRGRPARIAHRPVLAVVAVLAFVTGYGAWRLHATVLTPVGRVAVVQPNIGRDEKHDPALLDGNVGRLTALTREAAALRPQLVLWPETALAGILDDHPAWRDSLQAAARAAGAPVLTGVVQRFPPGADGRITLYNAAVVTDSTGQLGGHPDYRKRALVPVTERIPFVDPAWFSAQQPPPLRGFSVGTMHEPLMLDIGRVGALICFESAFPELARDYRAQGAHLIVNLTNDAVLGEGRGPAQHLAHLAVRAVEGRVAVIQAANSGISAYASPRGELHDPTPRDTALVRAYDVSATSAASLYVAVGDWLGLTSALGAALLAVAGLRVRRRARG